MAVTRFVSAGLTEGSFKDPYYTFVNPNYFAGSLNTRGMLIYHKASHPIDDERLEEILAARNTSWGGKPDIKALEALGIYGFVKRLFTPLGVEGPILVHEFAIKHPDLITISKNLPQLQLISTSGIPTEQNPTIYGQLFITPEFAREKEDDTRILDRAFVLEQTLAGYEGEQRAELLQALNAYHYGLIYHNTESQVALAQIRDFIPEFSLSDFAGADSIEPHSDIQTGV